MRRRAARRWRAGGRAGRAAWADGGKSKQARAFKRAREGGWASAGKGRESGRPLCPPLPRLTATDPRIPSFTSTRPRGEPRRGRGQPPRKPSTAMTFDPGLLFTTTSRRRPPCILFPFSGLAHIAPILHHAAISRTPLVIITQLSPSAPGQPATNRLACALTHALRKWESREDGELGAPGEEAAQDSLDRISEAHFRQGGGQSPWQ